MENAFDPVGSEGVAHGYYGTGFQAGGSDERNGRRSANAGCGFYPNSSEASGRSSSSTTEKYTVRFTSAERLIDSVKSEE